jgi:outer membrane protein assembly factor BamE (lipoprotein component of BamABCDE complex)
MHTTEVRRADVFTLADLKQPPLHLKVLRRTPIMSLHDANKAVAQLSPGQTVEVVGLGEDQYSVKARTATGQVAGWVAADAVEAPPIELQEKLRQRRVHAEEHRDLIERHGVAVGMTCAEVRASLGKPDRTARSRTRSGDEEQWFYVTYKYTPHFVQQQKEDGRFNHTLSYGRVPTGHRIITFRQDQVVEIVEDEGTDSQHPEKAATAQPGQ